MALHSARRAATAYCYWDLVESPLPSLIVAVDADGRLLEIRFDRRRPEGRRDAKRCKVAASQLGEYFAGKRRELCARHHASAATIAALDEKRSPGGRGGLDAQRHQQQHIAIGLAAEVERFGRNERDA